MRRLILLICVAVLILDLADDGCLGKVKFVAPNHTAQVSIASSSQISGKVDSQAGLPPVTLRDLQQQFTGRPLSFGAGHCGEIGNFSFHGSSGGIPL